MKSRKLIAVDLDDVLADSARGFVDFSNQMWGSSLDFNDYSEDWAKVWKVDLDEAMRRAAAFHASGAVQNYRPSKNASAVLGRLVKSYDLIVVTSRRKILQSETQHWIDHNFPHLFKAVHYSGIWDAELDEKSLGHTITHTKADICLALGVDYLIDDQIKHCVGSARQGIKVLLFGDYGWNRQNLDMEDITRVLDWDKVAEYFNV